MQLINPNEDALDTSYHPIASNYSVVIAEAQKRAISRFLNDLITAGIDSVLVDAAALGAGFNTGTAAPKTLRNGVGTTVNTPLWTPDGLYFNFGIGGAVQSVAHFPVADTKVFTLICDIKGVTSGQQSGGSAFGLQNAAGGVNASGVVALLNGSANAYIYANQGGAASISDDCANSGSSNTHHFYNPLDQVVSISSDNAAGNNATFKMHVDGVEVINDSSGNKTVTGAMNRVVLGGRQDSVSTFGVPWVGSCRSWALFSRVLTTVENAAVVRALRHLDMRRMNLVWIGDSRHAQISDSTHVGLDVPWLVANSTQYATRARLYNKAVNGIDAADIDDIFPLQVAPFAPDGLGVTEALLFDFSGINDLLDSDSAATILLNRQLLWSMSKAVGFRVAVGTVEASLTDANDGTTPGLTSAMEAVRVTLNTNTRASKGYDLLIDTDLLFGAARGGSITTISLIVAGTDTITTTAVHRQKPGNRVRFRGTVPTEIVADQDYWVKTTPSTTTLTLSASKTGGTVNATLDLIATTTGAVMYNPGTMFLDPLHESVEGKRALAQFILNTIPNKKAIARIITLTDAVTIATDCLYVGDETTLVCTLGANRTLGNPTNMVDGHRLRYRFRQDTTGNRTLALGSKFVVGPFVVTLSVGANLSDYLEVEYDAERDAFDVVNFRAGYG